MNPNELLAKMFAQQQAGAPQMQVPQGPPPPPAVAGPPAPSQGPPKGPPQKKKGKAKPKGRK